MEDSSRQPPASPACRPSNIPRSRCHGGNPFWRSPGDLSANAARRNREATHSGKAPSTSAERADRLLQGLALSPAQSTRIRRGPETRGEVLEQRRPRCRRQALSPRKLRDNPPEREESQRPLQLPDLSPASRHTCCKTR